MEKKQAFEKDAEMTEYILEMAHTGRSPQEWTSFVSKINDLYSQSKLNDKYQEVLSENERLRKYIDYKDKFNDDNDDHFFKLGINVGKTKFNH